MSEPTRWRTATADCFQALLAVARALGTALVAIYLVGPALAVLVMLFVGPFIGFLDGEIMPYVVGWAGVGTVALLYYLDWRQGTL